MARRTPRVEGTTLVDPAGTVTVEVGTAAWYAWLDAAELFAFVGERGSFTARKERRGTSGSYWKAYRTRNGALRRAYLGKSADLTLERLNAAAQTLAGPAEPTSVASAEPANLGRNASPAYERLTRRDHPIILATKLYIPAPLPNLVVRSRLIERLDGGLRGKLTLVSAPAGFGKTTLISAWRASPTAEDLGFAWVSLDRTDNDPIQFWTYVVTALDRLLPGVGADALLALRSPQPPAIQSLLTSLLNAISGPNASVRRHDRTTEAHSPSVLVLDDYHVIETMAIHEALAFLLDYLPSGLHVLIATRSDPPLPLARWRARGLLNELHAADLRFTAEETAAFLTQIMRLPLSRPDVQALEIRTEGWIAGLQLAALAMRDHPDRPNFVAAFTGSHRFIMDYLGSEVLAQQAPRLQMFLRTTSILERMCGALCDAVIGDPASGKSQSLLEELERANLFVVPLDDERRWYRYHHLFSEVLRAGLARDADAAAIASLHRRASSWYEEQGLVAEAVRHALAAADWERAARLIEERGLSLLLSGQIDTIQGWLTALPEALIGERAWLSILRAATLLFTNQLEAAERWLEAAETSVQLDWPADQVALIRGYVATIRSGIIHFSGDLEGCVALGQQALRLLPPTDRLSYPLALVLAAHDYLITGEVTQSVERRVAAVPAAVRASGNLVASLGALTNLAELQVVQGRLHRARRTYEEAARVAPGSGGLQILVGSPAYFFGLGDILRERNELEAAEQLVAQGMELVAGSVTVHADVAMYGYITQARLQRARGAILEAIATLEAFAVLAQRRAYVPRVVARAAAVQASFALARDDLAAAAAWAATSGLDIDDRLSYLQETEYLTLARVLVAQGRDEPDPAAVHSALRLVGRLLEAAEAGARAHSVIETLIVRALAQQARNASSEAHVSLARALTLATPEGYVRLFVDEGAPMAALLLQLRRADRQGRWGILQDPSSDYLDRLLAVFGADPTVALDLPPLSGSIKPLIEPLTARERDVLRLIVTGLSSREIARQLVISTDTLKTHIKNIYSKLGVHSRVQAVERARALELLDRTA